MNEVEAKVNTDEILLKDVIQLLSRNLKFILILTGTLVLITIIYSLFLPNVYVAESTLKPTSTNTSTLPSQANAMAALAGINLNNDAGDELGVALAVLRSKILVNKLMDYESFLPDLMAAQRWDPEDNRIIYDQDIYDLAKKNWVRNTSYPFKPRPSSQEAFIEFSKQVTFNYDTTDNILTLSVEHISPYVAYQWSKWITKEVNAIVANFRIKEAEGSIEYLNNQVKVTPYAELRIMFYELIKESTQSMMLAKVNPEYVLTTIDPPLIPELKSKPNRLLMVILGALMGSILSVLILFLRWHMWSNTNDPLEELKKWILSKKK